MKTKFREGIPIKSVEWYIFRITVKTSVSELYLLTLLESIYEGDVIMKNVSQEDKFVGLSVFSVGGNETERTYRIYEIYQ